MGEDRKQQILAALTDELRRQSADMHRLDIVALAGAIDAALSNPTSAGPIDEGKTPDQLNAANDE